MDPTQRKHSILMAAKRVFAHKGYHMAGVADIIEEAGVARGTFYLYFKSKREIFSALMEYTIQSLSEAFIEIPLEQPEKIIDTVLQNFEVIKSQFFSDPDLAKFIIHEATSADSEAYERFQEVKTQMATWLSSLIKQWQDVGILRELDPDIMAYSFIGSIKEILEQYLVTGNLSSGEDDISEVLIKLYLFGIVTFESNKMAEEHMKEIS